MFHRMLAGETKSNRANAGCSEDFTITMEVVQGFLKAEECFIGVYILPGNITEVKERSEAANHFRGDVTFDCRNIHLY